MKTTETGAGKRLLAAVAWAVLLGWVVFVYYDYYRQLSEKSEFKSAAKTLHLLIPGGRR
jgi:hypothetical protein